MLRRISDGKGPKYHPEAVTTAPTTHLALVWLTPGQNTGRQSHRTKAAAVAGSLEIIPASSDLDARWQIVEERLLVALSSDCLLQLAETELEAEELEFYPPEPGTVDRQAHSLAQTIAQELEISGLGAEHRLDALHTLFLLHILRNYSSLGKRSAQQLNGGLTPSTWRKVCDFIENHIAEPLPIERLASVARLSPSHFARAFRKTAGQSPHNYIVASRLTLARDQLIETKLPLNQIAGNAGFSSHSHMTATMKQLWGKTPVEYRRAR